MGNKIQQAIISEKIKSLKLAFNETSNSVFWDEETKTLKHPGEFGMYREAVCKDFLRFIIPQRLSIGSGFIINSNDKVSTQCDIIIYDKECTPLIEDSERQKFFPVESIVAVGEVKSNLSKDGLKDAINKLARVKELREYNRAPLPIRKIIEGDFDPIGEPYDNLFSFLICKKFNFDLKEILMDIDKLYDPDIKPWQKHNLILSLDDGLISYILNLEGKQQVFPYPFAHKTLSRNSLVKTNNDAHLYIFSTYMFGNTASISTYLPDLQCYLGYKMDFSFIHG